jgi:hypothetical protein
VRTPILVRSFSTVLHFLKVDEAWRLSRNYLERFLALQLHLLDHPRLLEFFQHGVDGGFVVGAKVGQDLAVGFDVVRGFAEVGDEIQDVDLFHEVHVHFVLLAVQSMCHRHDARKSIKNKG